MRSRFALCLSFVASIAAARDTNAQLAGITDGTRVRINRLVFLPGIDGVVVSHTPDTLVIRVEPDRPLRVAVSSIKRLERFEGRSYSVGAIQGGIAGGAVGVLFAANAIVAHRPSFGKGAATTLAEVGILGGVGAVIGGILGKEKWSGLSIHF